MTFNTLPNDPFFVGFDRILDKMHTINKNQQNYPPYNIVKTGEHSYRVEVAVAGFTKEELTIEVVDGTLTIEGSSKKDESTESFIHKGIGTRDFKRTFTLADTVEVRGADLTNGILSVTLENVIPEKKKPRLIEIGTTVSDQQFLTE